MRACLIALLFAVGSAGAACPPPPAPASTQATVPDRGLLWRLRRDGHESYLFGSLHLGRPDWTQPGPALRQAWAATELLALELDISDPQTLRALTQTPPLARPLAPALQARLSAQAQAACLPERALAPLHPLLQLSTLTLLAGRWDGLDASFGQEAMLLAMARGEQRPVVALERVEDQLRALIPSDPAELLRGIEQGLEQLEQAKVRAPMLALALAWERGDLARLEDYERWCDCIASEDDRRWLRRINDERNGPLAERIAALHGSGKRVLAAVGALHMSGSQALPLLLARLGFEVERVGARP